MSHPHPLGTSASSQSSQEAVDPKFVAEGLLKAREKTLLVFEKIRSRLEFGMTEDEARKLALQTFAEFGVTKHWHKCYIRFGAGTALTFNEPLQPDYRLQLNDPCYMDFGPVWSFKSDPELGLEYEGDYGDTFVFGENLEAEKCADAARSLFKEARALWNREKTSGEAVYEFLKKRADEMGYVLIDDVDGHRLSDFPHHQYSKQHLKEMPFCPNPSLWVLEVKINHPSHRFGAFFEDILAVSQ